MVKIGKKETRYVLAVVSGDARVDLNAVKALLGGTYVSFASPDVAERLAGSVAGTILPFSFDPKLDLVANPSLVENDELFFNAARLDRSMALKTGDYVALAKPRLERIAGGRDAAFQAVPATKAPDDPAPVPRPNRRVGKETSVGTQSRYAINLDVRYEPPELIDVRALVDACEEPWRNQRLTRVNDCVVRLGVVQGEFHWHKHDDEDEFFDVVDGRFVIELEDRTVELAPRQGFTVPRGVMHRPRAQERTVIPMMEGAGVVPTGNGAARSDAPER